ncbi:MAG: chemotaxis protein CheD [Pseudomonadota bacterium]
MKKIITIRIGELYVSRVPVIIHTMVGSCVAVCLFDSVNKIGAMNHILLADLSGRQDGISNPRYATRSMEILLKKTKNLETAKGRIISKLFGGAHVLPGISAQDAPGPKIVQAVLEFLASHWIPVVSQDTGGDKGRHVYLHTDTGKVIIKPVGSPPYSKRHQPPSSPKES